MPTAAKPKTGQYIAPGFLTFDSVSDGVLSVKALLMVEGEWTSMEGSTTKYDRAKLEKIATASNALLERGDRVPLMIDHEYSQKNVIGTVTGPFVAEEITTDTLPHPGMTDLIGKWGVFANIQLSGDDNITQYRDGRIKSLSVGVNIKANEIFEVSAVVWGAIRGASLFSGLKKESPAIALAVNIVERYALTLAEEVVDKAQEQAEQRLWMLWDSFSTVLWDIRRADGSNTLPEGQTADQLRSKAVEDFVAALRTQLNTPAPATIADPLTTVPLFSNPMTDNTNPTPETQTYSAADFQRLQDQIALQNRQIELFNRRSTLTDRFSIARTKAQQLVSSGKMTPNSFKKKFEEIQAPAIATYSKTEDADAAEQQLATFEQQLIKIEAVVEDLEENGTTVKFGMPVERDLTDPVERKQEEIDAEAERLTNSAARFGRIV